MSSYYVTIRNQSGQTIYALGPFKSHRRALGLVTATRQRVARAGLDQWCEFGYGTSRVYGGLRPLGAFNAVMNIGADGYCNAPARQLAPQLLARLAAA